MSPLLRVQLREFFKGCQNCADGAHSYSQRNAMASRAQNGWLRSTSITTRGSAARWAEVWIGLTLANSSHPNRSAQALRGCSALINNAANPETGTYPKVVHFLPLFPGLGLTRSRNAVTRPSAAIIRSRSPTSNPTKCRANCHS
jgi:hypothetical protein